MTKVDKMVPWTLDPTATSRATDRSPSACARESALGRDPSPHCGACGRRCSVLCCSHALWSARRCLWSLSSSACAPGEKSSHLCSSTCALPLRRASSRPSRRPQIRPRPRFRGPNTRTAHEWLLVSHCKLDARAGVEHEGSTGICLGERLSLWRMSLTQQLAGRAPREEAERYCPAANDRTVIRARRKL